MTTNRLLFLNLTSETLLVSFLDAGSKKSVSALVSPSRNEDFTTSNWNQFASLELSSRDDNSSVGLIRNFPRKFLRCKTSWELISCKPSIPWIVYKLRRSRNQYHLLVLPKRSLSSFLADMPSSIPLSSLLLPGTHESAAFYGWPISQCQDPATPITTQLQYGIRVLDIRLSIVNGELISYHGIFPEKLPFLDIIRTVHAYLNTSEGKTETIIMSVKQEDVGLDLFSQLVRDAVYNGPGGRQIWFLENRIPTLGEVRGKMVLFSRWGGDGSGWEGGLEGMGIHPGAWPDSKPDGFEWDLKGTKVKTHDWYSISTFTAIPEKAARASAILVQPTPPPPNPILSITFLSASSFPLALPPMVACGFGWPAWGLGVEGVNSRVGKWILSLLMGVSTTDNLEKLPKFVSRPRDAQINKRHSLLAQQGEPRLRGWCFVDYYKEPLDVGLVRILVECNYLGRKAGEEGWPSNTT